MELKLSENIKRLRKEKGMTQENLAQLLNISTAAVSKWESNQSYPDITMIFPLARIFSVSTDELMGYDTSKIENEIEKTIEEYRALYFNGEFAKANDHIIAARNTYPNDYRIMNLYMWNKAGGSADNDPNLLNEHHDELLQICEVLLENCLDEKIRLEALTMKAKLFHASGDTKNALEVLENFPSWYQTSGQKTEQLFDKSTPEFRYWIRKNMYELLDFAANKIVKAIWYTEDTTPQERIKKAENFGDLLLEYSNNEGWEFLSNVANSIYSELSGKILFLKDYKDYYLPIKDKDLYSAMKASLAATKDSVLADYFMEKNEIHNFIEYKLNILETSNFPSYVELRKDKDFNELVQKYRHQSKIQNKL